jgi:voltage-gated potassium channel
MAHVGDRGFERRFDERVQRKGLHLRFAAYVIISTWAVGIVTFGIVEFLVNRQEYTTIWWAMWWAIQTVTTVGYGDAVPTNTAGHVVAAALMLGGLSLYAVVTALITSAFVSRTGVGREDPLESEVAKLSETVASQNDKLDAMAAELGRLRNPGN